MSALRDAVASKGLGAISGYRAVNSHHAATPPPEIYPYRGQETEAAVFSPGSGQLLQVGTRQYFSGLTNIFTGIE